MVHSYDFWCINDARGRHLCLNMAMLQCMQARYFPWGGRNGLFRVFNMQIDILVIFHGHTCGKETKPRQIPPRRGVVGPKKNQTRFYRRTQHKRQTEVGTYVATHMCSRAPSISKCGSKPCVRMYGRIHQNLRRRRRGGGGGGGNMAAAGGWGGGKQQHSHSFPISPIAGLLDRWIAQVYSGWPLTHSGRALVTLNMHALLI